MNVEKRESWMTLIIYYLRLGKLSTNKKEIRKVECQSMYLFIENEQLYKEGFVLSSLCYLHLYKANYVLREIYEGICGSHLEGITIALKAIHLGYY